MKHYHRLATVKAGNHFRAVIDWIESQGKTQDEIDDFFLCDEVATFELAGEMYEYECTHLRDDVYEIWEVNAPYPTSPKGEF